MAAPSVRAALACISVVAVAGLAACGGGSKQTQGGSASRSHVVVLVMENKEEQDVIGNPDAPYLNELARRYALATASFAITHPSLPNYLALTSGSTHGISTDCDSCRVSARNLVDELEKAGISWKAYMQDLPGPCFRGAVAGAYAKRHDPFLYYDDVSSSTSRCRKIVPLSQLGSDLRAGDLPRFAFISPNLCSDTHDCGVAAGDRFLAGVVPPLLARLGPRGFLVVTWDEGSSNAGCCGVAQGGHIATLVAGPAVPAGASSGAALDHYGVLRSVEDSLGLPHLGESARATNGSLGPLLPARRPPGRPD